MSTAELLALAEACALLEEGVAGIRDIDAAMAFGAGMSPGPFARADQAGLDTVLSEMEASDDEALTPPPVMRRLVAQGRLGVAAGQGFHPYPLTGDEGAVRFEVREGVGIAWLANPPANSISADVVAGLRSAWSRVQEEDVRALVIASASPALFCAGADIRAFAAMDDPAALLDDVHGLLREFERSRVVTVAAVNGLALGGGCELAMACDVRIASAAAVFGQPEINLGIIPGFGGTQRLPRLVGSAKALEMNLSGESISADDAYEHGLVNRVVADHELFDTALRFARELATRAPIAIEQIKRASTAAGLDAGVDAEKAGFATAFTSEDGREGVAAFMEKRRPNWQGR